MPAPNLLGRAVSLMLDIGPPEFPSRLCVEIVSTDRSLTVVEQEALHEGTASGWLGPRRRDELLTSNPQPSDGHVIGFRNTEPRDAMAAFCRLSVGSRPEREWPGFLLDLLMSPEARVPVISQGKPVSDWVTLEPALRTATAIAVSSTPAGTSGRPVWTLVACQPKELFLVRAVEPDETTSLATGSGTEIRKALGL
ncbi:hypothetical protein [Streptomyces sp. NPDC055287]